MINFADIVTPLAGVWIEIYRVPFLEDGAVVTPLAGVWIEIPPPFMEKLTGWSLPLRECGLKFWYSTRADG